MYLKLILIIFLFTHYSLASDEEDFYDGDPDELPPTLSMKYIRQNIQKSGDEQRKEQVITLESSYKPLVVGDSASLIHRNTIEAHKSTGIPLFGLSYPERIVDWQDHGYHYLIGQVNKSVYNEKRVSNINYIILGLDAVAIMQDEDGYCYLDRTTKPLLFDRATNQITLIETDTTEYLVFISYPSTLRIPINSIINSNFIRALIPILSGHKSKRINIDLNEFDGTSFFLFFLS